jgi:hypothetical protein
LKNVRFKTLALRKAALTVTLLLLALYIAFGNETPTPYDLIRLETGVAVDANGNNQPLLDSKTLTQQDEAKPQRQAKILEERGDVKCDHQNLTTLPATAQSACLGTASESTSLARSNAAPTVQPTSAAEVVILAEVYARLVEEDEALEPFKEPTPIPMNL